MQTTKRCPAYLFLKNLSNSFIYKTYRYSQVKKSYFISYFLYLIFIIDKLWSTLKLKSFGIIISCLVIYFVLYTAMLLLEEKLKNAMASAEGFR